MRKIFLSFFIIWNLSLFCQKTDCKEWISLNTDQNLNNTIEVSIWNYVSSHKIKNKYVAHSVINNWNTILNEIDIPLSRSLEILVMLKAEDGSCTAINGKFTQQHSGGGNFSGSNFEFTGKEKNCNCTCAQQAYLSKAPAEEGPETGKDPLDSNQ